MPQVPEPAVLPVAPGPGPDLYNEVGAFVQARLDEGRRQVPAASDAAHALDAVQYLANRAAATADMLRLNVRTHPDQAVREARAEEAWETLRHIARRWNGHPDYRPQYAMTWRTHAEAGQS
ncbi:hypothetical protein [Streptomyces ipomoeae]|uniref:hypothetical protein n=1 Tax=Streptomyces ipomoeae TaxID=103232 RepID=UPI0029AAC544|nr:hypothetical protein [Streptomyces ipomoeae]MDX2692178.1 hypothetical protein [Streptomyces ipomoeae]MDX2839285.1 hypothetical protein [Streptomyces ipomoeae]